MIFERAQHALPGARKAHEQHVAGLQAQHAQQPQDLEKHGERCFLTLCRVNNALFDTVLIV